MVEGDGADVVDGVNGVVVMCGCGGEVPRREVVVETLERVGSLEVAHRVHHLEGFGVDEWVEEAMKGESESFSAIG